MKNQNKRLKKLERDLEKLERRLLKKGATKQNLSCLMLDIEWLPLQIESLRNFLKRDDLIFNDFWNIFDVIEELFKEANDESLEKEFWQVCFELATPDNLLDIKKLKGAYCGERAWAELIDRIHKGHIRKGQAIHILRQAMEEIESLRPIIVAELEKLGPLPGELLHIIDLPFMRFMPSLAAKIERLLRKKHKKKEPNIRIIDKIKKIVEELKTTKKGQE